MCDDGDQGSVQATLSALRALCHEPPSAEVWAQICAVFDTAPPASLPTALAYTRQHLDAAWPDTLRPPPDPWRIRALAGDDVPGWPLVRALSVVLVGYGSSRLMAIQAFRSVRPMRLMDAVALVGTPPVYAFECVGHADAQAMFEALQRTGADVRLVPDDASINTAQAYAQAIARTIVLRAWDRTQGGEVAAVQALLGVSALRILEAKRLVKALELADASPVTLVLRDDVMRASAALERLREVGFRAHLELPDPPSASVPSALAQLRACCHEAPSAPGWERLCRAVDAVPYDVRALAVEHVSAHLGASWPDHLRAPPEAWRVQLTRGVTPIGWSLVRAHHVVLVDVGEGASRMRTIHAVRDLVESFEAAVALVNARPSRVCSWVSAARAEHAARELRAAGAEVRVERTWETPEAEEPGAQGV